MYFVKYRTAFLCESVHAHCTCRNVSFASCWLIDWYNLKMRLRGTVPLLCSWFIEYGNCSFRTWATTWQLRIGVGTIIIGFILTPSTQLMDWWTVVPLSPELYHWLWLINCFLQSCGAELVLYVSLNFITGCGLIDQLFPTELRSRACFVCVPVLGTRCNSKRPF